MTPDSTLTRKAMANSKMHGLMNATTRNSLSLKSNGHHQVEGLGVSSTQQLKSSRTAVLPTITHHLSSSSHSSIKTAICITINGPSNTHHQGSKTTHHQGSRTTHHQGSRTIPHPDSRTTHLAKSRTTHHAKPKSRVSGRGLSPGRTLVPPLACLQSNFTSPQAAAPR